MEKKPLTPPDSHRDLVSGDQGMSIVASSQLPGSNGQFYFFECINRPSQLGFLLVLIVICAEVQIEHAAQDIAKLVAAFFHAFLANERKLG